MTIDLSKEAVKRFKLVRSDPGYSDQMCVRPDGYYVRYDDYAALRAALDRAEARVAKLEAFVADFAAAKFTRIDRRAPDPQDDLGQLTEYLPVEVWQDDARAALADKGGE